MLLFGERPAVIVGFIGFSAPAFIIFFAEQSRFFGHLIAIVERKPPLFRTSSVKQGNDRHHDTQQEQSDRNGNGQQNKSYKQRENRRSQNSKHHTSEQSISDFLTGRREQIQMPFQIIDPVGDTTQKRSR